MEGIHVAITAEKLTEWMGIPITNTLIMSWVVLFLLIALTFSLRARIALVPSKLQLLFELLIEYIFAFIESTLESKVLAERFFPLITTIFLFIFSANILEFIPGVDSIGFFVHGAESALGTHTEFVPLLRSMNTDLNVTLALSIIVFLVIEISGVITLGFFKYFSRFLNFHSPILFFVGIIEFVSELIRLISFSFRLFGNIFAGHVLLSVVVFLSPFVLPVPFMVFEVFVGFIQAAIFSLLTLFFIKLAIAQPAH